MTTPYDRIAESYIAADKELGRGAPRRPQPAPAPRPTRQEVPTAQPQRVGPPPGPPPGPGPFLSRYVGSPGPGGPSSGFPGGLTGGLTEEQVAIDELYEIVLSGNLGPGGGNQGIPTPLPVEVDEPPPGPRQGGFLERFVNRMGSRADAGLEALQILDEVAGLGGPSASEQFIHAGEEVLMGLDAFQQAGQSFVPAELQAAARVTPIGAVATGLENATQGDLGGGLGIVGALGTTIVQARELYQGVRDPSRFQADVEANRAANEAGRETLRQLITLAMSPREAEKELAEQLNQRPIAAQIAGAVIDPLAAGGAIKGGVAAGRVIGQRGGPAIRTLGQRLSPAVAGEAGFVRVPGSRIPEDVATVINGRITELETALAKPGRLPKGMGTRKEALTELGGLKGDSFIADTIQEFDTPDGVLANVRNEFDTAAEELMARSQPFHAGKKALYPTVKVAELDGYAKTLDDFVQEMDASRIANQGAGDPNIGGMTLRETVKTPESMGSPLPGRPAPNILDELAIGEANRAAEATPVRQFIEDLKTRMIEGEGDFAGMEPVLRQGREAAIAVHTARWGPERLAKYGLEPAPDIEVAFGRAYRPAARDTPPRTAVQGGFGIGEPEQVAAQGERARLLREGQEALPEARAGQQALSVPDDDLELIRSGIDDLSNSSTEELLEEVKLNLAFVDINNIQGRLPQLSEGELIATLRMRNAVLKLHERGMESDEIFRRVGQPLGGEAKPSLVPEVLPNLSIESGRPPGQPTVPPVATAAQIPPVGPLRLGPSVMGDFSGDFSQVVSLATQPDIWRRLANLPGLRTVFGSFNPSAIANKPAELALAGRAVLREEGQQLSQTATARLNGIGTQEQVFGATTPEGMLRSGPMEGLTVNTIRSNPSKYTAQTTPVMKEWIQAADDIERAKLAFLRANGIPVVELSFEEGGQYAGRRVWGKMTQGGEMLDTAFVGPGPGRPGARLASEKHRIFTTAEDAIKEGYRYIPDDEALFLNVQGAYNRVADKRMTDWLLTKVDWRTTGAPEGLKVAAFAANERKRHAQQLVAGLNRAVRGERLTPQTINSIRTSFPDQADALEQLVPLLQEPNAQTAPAVQALTREARGLLSDAQADAGRAIEARARGREEALTTKFEESTIPAPAFAGKILTGPEAKETTRILKESLDPRFSQALDSVNQVNGVARYFMLAGDISPMAIQLLYLAGASPRIYGKAMRGMARSIFDTRFQARYLARSENVAIVQKYPTLILTRGGATEFTEAMARGGLLRKGPQKVAGTVLEPFQRGFEGALDVAGIEMAKAYDHLGTTPQRINDLAQFINEFRGVTSSRRLGVSLIHRQAETAAVLAPRYNRAIAALAFDTVRGGLRGQLARRSLAQGIGALTIMALAISYARGESPQQMVAHITPGSPKFFTWEVGGQNIGPGTKVRSVANLFARTVADPGSLGASGAFTWMQNPALRFIRGNLSPAISTGVDLLTGRDFIGDSTRDGLLSFSKTVGENFMPIWVQTVALEGGSLADRALRGATEFTGGRAYPVNIIWKLGGEWRSDLDAYYEIETTKEKREAKGQRQSRLDFRKRNPEIDAKLYITGRVTSLRSGSAKRAALRLLEENNVFAFHVPAEFIKEYEDDLGKDRIDRIRQAQQGASQESSPGTPSVAPAPVATPVPPTAPAQPVAPTAAPQGTSRWEDITPSLVGSIRPALGAFWKTGKPLTAQQETQMRRLHAEHPMGQPDFDRWLRETLSRALDDYLRRQSNRLPAPTPAAPRELVGVGS